MLSVFSEFCGTIGTFFPVLLSCNHCFLFRLAFLALPPRCAVSIPSLQTGVFSVPSKPVKSGFGVLKSSFTEKQLKQNQPKPHGLVVLELNALFPLPSLVLWDMEQEHSRSFRLFRSGKHWGRAWRGGGVLLC